jgi:radical SAM protein (TIGR04043 family)
VNASDSIVRKKAEMQARGVSIPPELLPELEAKYNAPAIRTGRMVLCLQHSSEIIPAFIVNGKRAAYSPLRLVKTGERQYEIWNDDRKYTDICLLPRPAYYDNTTSQGIPLYKLAVIVGPGHLRSVVNQRCYYQQLDKACRFCAVQYWWDGKEDKHTSDIADTVATGVREGIATHVSLTTATLNTRGKGLEDLVETARLIRKIVQVPVMFEFEPINDDALLEAMLQEAKQAGVTTVACNIECFDEHLRPQVMPLKGLIPVRRYQKTWEKCLEIFGKNEVFTTVVAGIGESDESIINGIAIAAAQGVMTFLVPHSPANGAVYADMAAPTADRMLALYEKAVDIYSHNSLDICACQAGCVRGSGFSAIKDVARFGIE